MSSRLQIMGLTIFGLLLFAEVTVVAAPPYMSSRKVTRFVALRGHTVWTTGNSARAMGSIRIGVAYIQRDYRVTPE